MSGQFLGRLGPLHWEPIAQPWKECADQVAAEDAERLLPRVSARALAEFLDEQDDAVRLALNT